jgi:hypothetical protein
MALNYDILLRVGGGLAGVYLLLSLFNVHWLTRVRTLASLLIGAIVVGWMGWPMVRPDDPMGAICLVDNMITPGELLMLSVLAFTAGLLAYLASWPKGSLTAPLAAPAGMAAWIFASGDMRTLFMTNSTLPERQMAYAVLCWEGLFWLIPVAAGMLGVLAGWFFQTRNQKLELPKPFTGNNKPANLAIAAAASLAITWFLIGILAQDVRQADDKLGFVVGQPGKGQIAFAVCVAFLAAGFAVTHFIKIGYIIPMACTAIAVFIAMRYAASPIRLEQMTQNWPVAYVVLSICGVLPIQMVAFGTLGAFIGYQSAMKVRESSSQA